MNRSALLAVAVSIFITLLLIASMTPAFFSERPNEEPNVFVGVDIAYGGEQAVYNITNAVAGYANLIILGSLNVTMNTTTLTTVCNYLYQKGFYFIVYVGFAKVGYLPPQGPSPSFFEMAMQRWPGKFLGAYMFDEVGGKQLDSSAPSRPISAASNYSDAAVHFIMGTQPFIEMYKDLYYSVPNMKVYTSDYALYWFDYLSGYDTVFCEFVGNQSRQLAVAMTRGAATSLGKQWGAIITYGTCNGDGTACMENASALYSDMMLAWENDAKYIVVFDSPLNSTATPYGVLTQEHLDAMKNFWSYIHDHQQPNLSVNTAFVLPTDYGYGFRGSADTIWGLWPADALAPKIWNETNSLLATYGMNLDIVYQNKTYNIPVNLPYKTLIYWNGTEITK